MPVEFVNGRNLCRLGKQASVHTMPVEFKDGMKKCRFDLPPLIYTMQIGLYANNYDGIYGSKSFHPFSSSTLVFSVPLKLCYHHIFHRFQNLPASCERNFTYLLATLMHSKKSLKLKDILTAIFMEDRDN